MLSSNEDILNSFKAALKFDSIPQPNIQYFENYIEIAENNHIWGTILLCCFVWKL